MLNRRKVTKKATRKVVRRRVVRKSAKRSLINSKSYPFPRTITRKLKYCDFVNINPGLGGVASYSFSCNGLHDPNITGVGHQPYGYDQMGFLYNHYEVLSSRIKITVPSSDYLVPTVLLTKVDADGNFNTVNPSLLMEQPDVKYTIGIPEQVKAMVVRNSWSQRKFFGDRKSGDSSLCGSITSATNPSDMSFFLIGFGPMDPLFDGPIVQVAVEMEYVVRFFEPKELTSS